MLIKYFRLWLAFAHAFLLVWFKFPRASREEKLSHIQNWSRHVLALLGITVEVTQASPLTSPQPTQLLVANHVSWLDVLVIQALQPCVFVAKSEVANWPLVGSIARACGVVFVDRSSSTSARKMVDDVTNALHHGYCVAGFPEGTSSVGHTVSLFHANLFEAAIHRDVHVLPLAVRYTHARSGHLCTNAAFVGDIGFLASLHQIMTTPDLCVSVHTGLAIAPRGHSRRTLAHVCHRSVVHQLQMLQA